MMEMPTPPNNEDMMVNVIRKAYVDIADGQVHYRGVAGTGRPVIFLHQTASSGAMWEKVMDCWTGSHRLCAFDTPGFGGSFDPPGTTSMPLYAGWIAEAMTALGIEQAHFIGHHTGGGIALEIAATMPERAASIAMFGPAILTPAERDVFAAKLGAAFRPTRSGAYLLKNWEYLRVGGADQDIALLHREMIDMLRAWASRPHAYAAAWAQDAVPLIEQLTCPAIAICARDDILFPYLDRLATLRPDIERVVLNTGANFEPDLASAELADILVRHIDAVEARAKPL